MCRRVRFRVVVTGFERHLGAVVGYDDDGEEEEVEVEAELDQARSGRLCPGNLGTGDQTEEIVTVLLLVRRDNGGDGYDDDSC